MQVYWISFRGKHRAYEQLSLNDDRVRPAYERHLFAVAAVSGGLCVACFVAEKFLGKAIIDGDLLDKARKQESLWVPDIRLPQAAGAYSWINPPSRSRRTTLPAGTATAGSSGHSGGVCPRARCGRWPL